MTPKELLTDGIEQLCEQHEPQDVESALEQVQILQDRRSRLGKLFDSQIATLKLRGCRTEIVEILQGRKIFVINKACRMNINGNSIPFLPVIKPSRASYYELMAMVQNGHERGLFEAFENYDICDYLETEASDAALYYAYDIQINTDWNICDCKDNNKSLPPRGVHEETCTALKRTFLTAAELVALALHSTDALQWNLWALESRCGSKTPLLCDEKDGRPILRNGGRYSMWTISVGVHYNISGDIPDKPHRYPTCGSRDDR